MFSPLEKNVVYMAEAKIENDLIRLRIVMNQFNIELDWKFTRSLTPSLACSKPYRRQVSTSTTLVMYSPGPLYNFSLIQTLFSPTCRVALHAP